MKEVIFKGMLAIMWATTIHYGFGKDVSIKKFGENHPLAWIILFLAFGIGGAMFLFSYVKSS